MKIKIVWIVFVFSSLLLAIIICNDLNIDMLKADDGKCDFVGDKILLLKNSQENISLPHLNIKGNVVNIDDNLIEIFLSDYSQNYLSTGNIFIKNTGVNLQKNDRVFIKFNDININKNYLHFSSIEVYKLEKNIEKNNIKKDFFICKNYDGKNLKISGESFYFNKNKYFLSNEDLSEDNELFFVNVKNKTLLVEEYKSKVFPFKIYNMINPQESKFNELIEIYKEMGKEDNK